MKSIFRSSALKGISPLKYFATGIFVLTISDAILSYVVPIYIQDAMQDAAKTGMVISLSSFFALFLDIFVANRLNHKNFKFFSSWMVWVSFVFPAVFLFLPGKVIFFAIAMMAWAIYYEFREFSKFDFVHRVAKVSEHVEFWSVLSTFQSTAYLIGPAIAVFLLDRVYKMPLWVSLAFITTAGFVFLTFNIYFKKASKNTKAALEEPHTYYKPAMMEFKVIRSLFIRVWPLMLFTTVLALIDVTMWTTGLLFAEQLREKDPVAGLILIAYELPALYVGYLAHKVFGNEHKKKHSFTLAMIAGLFMILAGTATNTYMIIFFIFITSTFYGVKAVLMNAVYEDYISRLEGTAATEMTSLSQICWNIAYTAGPIILGFIAKYQGLQFTLTFTGSAAVVASFIALAIVPEKIRMPQKELTQELFEIKV